MNVPMLALVLITGCAMDVDDEGDGGDGEAAPDDIGILAAGAVTLQPQADAYVRSGSYANTNFGRATTLTTDLADSGTVRQSYLRFDLTSVSAVTRATLRFYVIDGSTNAADVRTVTSATWDELKITYNTRPAVDGPVVGSIISASGGNWVSVDVTSAVKAGAWASFALVPRSENGLDVSSREASSNRPQLVIENSTCVATTCALQGKNCGSISDGCGGTLTCGSCTSPNTCGGGGTANVCGSASSCLSGSGPLVTISGPQSTVYDKRTLAAMTRADARTASWTNVANVPVRVGGGDQICWSGGTIRGTWDPMTTSWDAYHNTYAFQVYGNSMTVENLRVDNYGDAIFVRLESTLGNNFTVRGAYVTNNHDDCVEDDSMKAGTVEDSLFDGCYSFFSARQVSSQPIADGSGNVVTFRNNLVRLQGFPTYYGGSTTDPAQYKHMGFWKIDEYTRTPKLSIRNNIFRVDKDSHGWIPLVPNAKSIADASNNVIVWLGTGPFPEPVPPGFTVTTDKAVWDNAVAAWKANHGVQ